MSEQGAGAGRSDAGVGPTISPTARELLGRLGRVMDRVDLDRLAVWTFTLAVLASAALLYHLTRGTSFWGDDWVWVTTRRANTLGTILSPYDGHFSVLPIVLYRIMFAAFGIGSYAPYRGLVIILSLGVALLAYVYARQRVQRFPAVLVATLVLFIGPGWQDIMWAFQIGWELALGLGLAALISLDSRTRWGDVAACALTFGSICSTSFGVAFAIGVLFDVAFTRRRWRDIWIGVVPLLLYAVWALHYHPTGITWSDITLVPGNLVQTFAGGAAGIVGLTGATAINPVGVTLTFGPPLLIVLAFFSVRAVGRRRYDVRAATLLLVLVLFSALTTLGRAFETPLVSRYIYPDCVLVALYIVQLGRGRSISNLAQGGLALLVVLAVVSNIGVLRSAGVYLRQVGASTNADVATLDLEQGSVPSDYILTHLPDYPFVSITAGGYHAAERALGTPADSVQQIVHAPAVAQSTADQELIGERAIALGSGPSSKPDGGAPPGVTGSIGGSGSRVGACVRFAPARTSLPGASSSLTLSLAPGATRISAGPASVGVAARRFGPTANPIGTIGPGRTAIVLTRRDAAPEPWQITLTVTGPVRACTVR
jgi:hypothetical protein